MKNFLKNIIKRLIYYIKWNQYQIISYSQEGEDVIVGRIFNSIDNGFYIDIGAHHPIRFSNTYLLYLRGWKGMNIDAQPGSMKLFKKLRPSDINLEIAITEKIETLNYYQFNEPALNGFSKDLSEIRDGFSKYKIVNVMALEGYPLSMILQKNLPINQAIDLLSIDVEGFEFEVLKSNDWLIYRPKVIVLEILNSTLDNLPDNLSYKFLVSKNYVLYAKSNNSIFFIRNDYIKFIS